MDDFNIFTEEDKQHFSYALCVLGTTGAGATLGSLAGGQALLGAAGGAVWGLFTCKYVAEPIKRKLFSQHSQLTEPEFEHVFVAAKRQFPLATKAEVLDLIASARLAATRFPSRYQC